jgi:NADH:ubiquinone oxidoreductase subunit K
MLADSFGLYFAVILLVLAAVDTAIGLSLFMNYVNQGGNSDITTMRNLKG